VWECESGDPHKVGSSGKFLALGALAKKGVVPGLLSELSWGASSYKSQP
jgi:hypothetical protein